MVGRDYRGYVGKAEEYDRRGAVQFAVLTMMGLREDHHLLDIGCGSLRGGRLFIPYLLPGRYCGMDRPEAEPMVQEGLKNELGFSIVAAKRPLLMYSSEFFFGGFGHKFDYILAQAVFCHITLAQIRTCMGQVCKVMKRGATFVASFHEAEIDDKREKLVYPEVAWYTMDTIRKVAADVGLSCNRLNPLLMGATNLHDQYSRMAWVVMHQGAEG
jgi:hypothetical protein